jgi:hypothetical protein
MKILFDTHELNTTSHLSALMFSGRLRRNGPSKSYGFSGLSGGEHWGGEGWWGGGGGSIFRETFNSAPKL